MRVTDTATSPTEVERIAEGLSRFVNGGDSIEGAVRRFRQLGLPETAVEQGRVEYERRIGRIRTLQDPRALVTRELENGYWYAGPKEDDTFWPALRKRLSEDLNEDALQSVDDSSDKIVGLLRPPGSEEIDTRGLVLGYVQSGKTTSFMSVIAKAADVGYRLFIVLSGITDNLRSQTQERLEDVLVNELDSSWFLLTRRDSDFQWPGNASNLLSTEGNRLLAVVKKNPYRLRRLVEWLDSSGNRAADCPILIIDDEADQASLDVGAKNRTSRINGLIGQLLRKRKAGYVAYTATPFANLLASPETAQSLYPRDFVVDLPTPANYFGPERIFGREPLTPDEDASVTNEGLDLIRHVDPAEVSEVQPPRGKGAVDSWDPSSPPSLVEAVRWFVLATSARRERGTGNPHSSMLIHTTMLATGHVRLSHPVRRVLDELRHAVATGDESVYAELRDLWERESKRVPPQDPGDDPVTWERLMPHLPDVLGDTRVVVDNYQSSERLSYANDEPTTAIVIGGNTLSRGLTLEGLVCSYFVRSASAYDTILQMGRWFGYRRGYGDLTRIWVTADLESWFFDLATVEEEIRRDIRRYEDEQLTPAELPVKIRSHPAMAITSAAKMRHAVQAEISYGGSRRQTILFNHHDGEWLSQNREAARQLLRDAGAASGAEVDTATGRHLVRDVPVSNILDFLATYNFHERAFNMRSDLLADYIRKQNGEGFLHTWNVAVIGHPDSTNGTIDLGSGHPVNLIQRTRMDMPGQSHANIKSLVSTVDRVADLHPEQVDLGEIGSRRSLSDASLLEMREDLLGDVGLLCLYPISKDSQPRSPGRRDGKRRRLALDAVDHVIGAALFFPKSRGTASGVSYYSADLSSESVEEPENVELIDEADETAARAAEGGDPARDR